MSRMAQEVTRAVADLRRVSKRQGRGRTMPDGEDQGEPLAIEPEPAAEAVQLESSEAAEEPSERLGADQPGEWF